MKHVPETLPARVRTWSPARFAVGWLMAVAAAALAWYGSWWVLLAVGFMLLLSRFATTVVAVAFGQFVLASVMPLPAEAVLLVEGSLLVALLVATPFTDRRVGVGAALIFALLLGGGVWYTVTVAENSVWTVALGVVAVLSLGLYVQHRYLLVRLEGIV